MPEEDNAVWTRLRGDDDFKEMDSKKVRRLVSIAVAEVLGTGILVGLGCSATVVGLPTDGQVTHLNTVLSFAFAIATAIAVFGHISGAHVNPAVSLVALLYGLISLPVFFVYVISQIVGGVLGMMAIRVVTPTSCLEKNLCITLPHTDVGPAQAVLAEVFLTAILCIVVCAAWDRRTRNHQDSMPIKFGIAVVALALPGAKFSGASMNPARSFGPAFVSGNWQLHWIYWIGPMLGSVAATLIYRLFLDEPEQPPPTLGDVEESHPLS